MVEAAEPDRDAPDLVADLRQIFHEQEQPTSTLLERIADRLQRSGKYAEWFEVLKLKVRHQLGLPLLSTAAESLDDQLQLAYEQGLLDACRRVGLALLEAGRVRDAWTYLRPVGNAREILAILDQRVPVSQDNVDQVVELLLYEGLDPPRGYQLLLEHFGTCNAITAYHSALYGRPQAHRAGAAGLLVGHLYREVRDNLRAHAQRLALDWRESATLDEAVLRQPQLVADGAYHVDTTHLSSVVNIAREANELEHLREAFELAGYGAQLDATYHYASDAPFEETYPTHRLWFGALLGIQVPAAIEYFRQRAEQTDARQEGTRVIEQYVELLARLGDPLRAMNESLRLIPAGVHTTGLAPSLLELAHQAGDYAPLIDSAGRRDELLGYLLGLLGQRGERVF